MDKKYYHKRTERGRRKFVSIYNLLQSNFGETNGAWQSLESKAMKMSNIKENMRY